jgi:transposase
MARAATPVKLSNEERYTLLEWTRAGTTEQRYADRARIILAAAAGKRTGQIAAEMGTRPSRVSQWRGRFARLRLLGLQDAPRSGKPRRYTEETEKRVLEVLDQAPPQGRTRWTAVLVGTVTGVSTRHVHRILGQKGVNLERRRSWCISTDPEFSRKAADIVALYLAPPENAVVLCVDEKPHIQALERAQGWLKLPNGKALTGFGHEYRRHGPSTLFAALETATGMVRTGHYSRRRRREFLHFMNEVITEYGPDRELHVVLDNLRTHKPRCDRWLASHPTVHFHYTPTHASWLNQVEVWFSILGRQCLRGASFCSVAQLRQAIDGFTAAYTDRAAPFEWRKAVVHPKQPRHLLSKSKHSNGN